MRTVFTLLLAPERSRKIKATSQVVYRIFGESMTRIKPRDLWKQLDRSMSEAVQLHNREKSSVQGRSLVSTLASSALIIGCSQSEEAAEA